MKQDSIGGGNMNVSQFKLNENQLHIFFILHNSEQTQLLPEIEEKDEQISTLKANIDKLEAKDELGDALGLGSSVLHLLHRIFSMGFYTPKSSPAGDTSRGLESAKLAQAIGNQCFNTSLQCFCTMFAKFYKVVSFLSVVVQVFTMFLHFIVRMFKAFARPL